MSEDSMKIFLLDDVSSLPIKQYYRNVPIFTIFFFNGEG